MKPFPPCFYFKHGAYWLVKANKWHPLGKDLPSALAEYGRRTQTLRTNGMAKLIDAAMPTVCRKKADNTITQYRAVAETLKRKLALFTPPQVTTKTVYAIQEALADKPNMANRTITVLRGIFVYAVKHEPGVTTNPCTGVKRLEESKRTRRITDAEWHAIRDQAGPRLKLIMDLQYATGQRIGDVLSIRRSQLGPVGIAFKAQKTGKPLLVKWSPQMRAAVASAKELSGDTLTLFRGTRGGQPNYRSVHKQWADACLAAGIEDARPNDQRAQSLSDLKKQGGNTQGLGGHSSPATTDRYLRDRETPEVDGPILRQALDVGQKR